ncbi:hypothetical protein HanIR_Chr12g0598711 [Helianthus annuus]|nr:hypothetical protein HanIR_Chr12g0598711 [Helianthus annuus]
MCRCGRFVRLGECPRRYQVCGVKVLPGSVMLTIRHYLSERERWKQVLRVAVDATDETAVNLGRLIH